VHRPSALARCRRVLSPAKYALGHFRGWVVVAASFSTCFGLLVASGPAAAFSESLEHPEQIKTPPSRTIQLPSSAVVTLSLLRPQSEHLPIAGSCCVTSTMVPPSAPVKGGWWGERLGRDGGDDIEWLRRPHDVPGPAMPQCEPARGSVHSS
jgi:hypothetical protein